jgi:acyl-CoA reductase-like NAD-dependent aldehyde dehydrogenase
MSRAEEMLDRAVQAADELRRLNQSETDAVVRAVYLTALSERVRLAKMAHEETGVGIWQHKVIKNVIATQLVYEDIKLQKDEAVAPETIEAEFNRNY